MSKEEFWQMMTDYSVQCPNDDSFAAIVQKVWKITENPGSSVDNTQVMHVLGLMRQRLITLANSQQEEFKLRDMFRTFDKDKSGYLSADELAGLLAQLGVAVKDHELISVMNMLDKNKNGVIEFDEFENFVVVDPYKKYAF